ncbi:MAG TPA: 50S ribosomal protein L35 [bacterium]|jgi:ribosomal protein L35|nr:50S ribosomal protein L35 [Patescibacteria group bacterium]HOC96393.1 50S ribosomal protein L35 [bacterium]HPO11116.1 50S ribosomal protein L35 [bacterium]HQL12185.1 50S ribosomal protein L35 [bacterium]
MPKIKTVKKISKRFKLTKNGKVIQRKCGQDHFNSRESGKITRNKRKDIEIAKNTNIAKTLTKVLQNQ